MHEPAVKGNDRIKPQSLYTQQKRVRFELTEQLKMCHTVEESTEVFYITDVIISGP